MSTKKAKRKRAAAPVAAVVEAAKPVAPSQPTIVLATNCNVKDAAELKLSLCQHLESAIVSLDVGNVERVDTSTMQLLCAFVRDRVAHQRKVEWLGDSPVIRERRACSAWKRCCACRGAVGMMRILAADDSPSMRDMVRMSLSSAGFEVTSAADGEEALRLAAATPFDLVLLDVNMPVRDGIEVIRALRAEPQYRHTPILMLTTENSADRKREGKTAGATGWIVKPFDPAQLIATVHRVLLR